MKQRAAFGSRSFRRYRRGVTKTRRVGVVGAGQLARMMIEASADCGVQVVVLASTNDDSAVSLASEYKLGAATSYEALSDLAACCEFLTFDHELVDLEVLARLEREGVVLRPSPRSLAYSVDKAAQREYFAQLGIPLPDFLVLLEPDPAAVASFLKAHEGRAVVKLATGGYDGRGVFFADSPETATQLITNIAPSGTIVLEERLELIAEVSQMVVRGVDGAIETYPLVTTVQARGMCNEVRYPTALAAALVDQAEALTRHIAKAVELVGVMAVEYFVTEAGLVVNELALRPHNSGHWTIEACTTSQFANHLLAVSGQPLGPTTPLVEAAVMVNVVGADQPGSLEAAQAVAGAHVHDYGKSWRPGRKLGHVTVVGDDPAALRVTAWKSAHAYGTQSQESPT